MPDAKPTLTLAESLTRTLNQHRPLDTAAVPQLLAISVEALGWKIGRQAFEALAVNGFNEQRLLTCDLAHPTSADAVYLAGLRARIQARFNETLGAHQVHIRAVEKLQKQLVQPIAGLAKALAKFDQVEAAIKQAGDAAPEKLRGQLGAANGEVKKAQQRVDDLQAKIDAEFAAARLDMDVFLVAKRAQEYTISFPRVAGDTNPAQLLWAQHMIRQTHLWDPAGATFTSVVNRYL